MDRFIEEEKMKKKGYAIIGVFLVLALFTLGAAHYGTKTLSSVRAYLSGQGNWIKAQKQATNLLIRFVLYEDNQLYEQYREVLEVHKGLTQARLAMTAEDPRIESAMQGLQQGGIHPEDRGDIIWLTVNFQGLSYVDRALEIWEEGDVQVAKMDSLADHARRLMQEGVLDSTTQQSLIAEAVRLDEDLTRLETDFSNTLGAAGRWTRSVIFWAIAVSGLVLIGIGYVIIRSHFQDVNRLNKKLTESEKRFRTVLQNSRDVIYQIDIRTGGYDYISPSFEDMMGYSREYIQQEGRSFVMGLIHPDDKEALNEDIKEIAPEEVADKFSEHSEFRIKRKDGEYIWLENERKLVTDRDGKPASIVGIVRDITPRKMHELEMEKSLKEKQTLLQEIHHRVKNNLAVVTGILELQKQEPVHDSLEAVLEDAQSRIRSIAMIHEKLYDTESFSDIDIREYIEEFTDVVRTTYSSIQQEVVIRKELDSFTVDIVKAVPLGLIYNELLNNAFKHGFADGVGSEISVVLENENGYARLSVSDNGRPLPEDFDIDNTASLGMTLIKTLTEQLDGELNISQNGWTRFEVQFPIS